MNETRHEKIREQLAAYALGILPEEEEAAVERHLATCAGCLADVEAYRHVADDLAFAAPDEEPDAALKQRLMARIRTRDQRDVAPPSSSLWEVFAIALRGWRPVAVALAVLILISAALWWQQGRDEPVPAQRQITLTATDAAPGAQGVIRIGEETRQGTLSVEGLPVLEPDRQYQLWLIRDGVRDSGGVFSVADDGNATIEIDAPTPLDDYAAYGITIEPFGGSPGPTGERVLGFNL